MEATLMEEDANQSNLIEFVQEVSQKVMVN